MFKIKTIILHCKELDLRKKNIIKQMNKFNFLDYSFYENYDSKELDAQIIDKFYESKEKNESKWIKKVLLWGQDAIKYHTPILNKAEISLTIKFGKVFKDLSTQNFDYCIIFEDDILLCKKFDVLFLEYMSKTPEDWDAIYFGQCSKLHPQNIVNNQIAYKKTHPASRGADSIVLKKRTIEDLASTWFPFNLVSDWELGAQHFMHNHKVYWWEPALTWQGSEYGFYKSTLR